MTAAEFVKDYAVNRARELQSEMLSNEYTAKLRTLQGNERELRKCRQDLIDDLLEDREITSIQRHDEPRFCRQDVIDHAVRILEAKDLEELLKGDL